MIGTGVIRLSTENSSSRLSGYSVAAFSAAEAKVPPLRNLGLRLVDYYRLFFMKPQKYGDLDPIKIVQR